MIGSTGESPRSMLVWSVVIILGLLAGVGISRVPALVDVWDVAGGAFERRAAQDARNDGYYEELLDATEARGAGGWTRGPREIAPPDWVRLHETDGVIWDEPFQRFRLRPNADFDYKGARLAINADGLRDRPLRPRDAVDHRLAVVGSSVLMGSGVPVGETFENRIEDSIAQGVFGDRGAVEILNLGVAGYRLDQLADVVVERLERFDPDAVVLVLNDLAVNPNWSRHIAWLVAEGRDPRHGFLREVIDAAGVQQGDEPRVMAARLRPHRDAVVRGSLELAASWCERRGIPLVLLALAQPSSTGAFRTRLEEIRPLVSEVGLEIVDITDAYDDHGDPESLWLRPWDRHPTSEGHALMAARLAELLQSRPELADLLLGPRRDRGVGASDG